MTLTLNRRARLPIKRCQTRRRPEGGPGRAIAKAGRIERMKILVIDDSRAMRRIVTRSIGQAGHSDHDIIEAENGRDALTLVKSEAPDLVLSDWHMPEMSGIELLRELNDAGIEVPFGFVTANATRDMVAQAEAAGAIFLLARPFTAEDMAEVLGVFSGA